MGFDFTGKRVLVVDDNAEAADTLGTLLGILGAEVRVLYDGRAARFDEMTYA